MPLRIYHEQIIENSYTEISGGDAHHIINVLRLRENDSLILCDSFGGEYDAVITELRDKSVIVSLSNYRKNNSELPVNTTLFYALPKSDKFDYVIQKCTELGIKRIVPVLSERCVSRPDEKSAAKKLLRWQKIAEAAAAQSGRAIIPEVLPLKTFKRAAEEMANINCSFICFEGGGEYIGSFLKSAATKKSPKFPFFIGPEGGISLDEIALTDLLGIARVTLGPRILRTETAPVFVMSAISLSFCE